MFRILLIIAGSVACDLFAAAEQKLNTRPIPFVQALPLPHDEVSFQRGGIEIARYRYGRDLRRPFVYPVIGPAGRSLTRMGHPHDPVGHSHHNSIWISHQDVNGTSFWDDRGRGIIRHERLERLEDGDDSASVRTVNSWITSSNKTLLTERRLISMQLLPGNEWMLLIDLRLEAKEQEITLGKTPFGLIGVRMAKTIGVHDGGGTIRNSEGAVNEKEIFWKPAKWVDYSGQITSNAVEGLTLMDHPGNPNHPTIFHVREDGWMGASLTQKEPRVITPDKPLRLRYGIYVHAGFPERQTIEKQWMSFAQSTLPDLAQKKK